MEIIYPVTLGIKIDGSSPTYVYPAYANSTRYYRGDIVRYKPYDYWIDYKCVRGHTSPSSGFAAQFWDQLRYSAYTGGFTPDTNVATSLYTKWVSAEAITTGDVRYDEADQCDYIANIDITAGDNTGEANRPSALAEATEEGLQNRWTNLGTANLWNLIDGETAATLRGLSSANAVLNHAEVWLRLGGDTVNQLADAYDFTGWSVYNGTVAANQRLGADGLTSNADDFNATQNDASISKALTGLTPGARISIGIWIKSPNVANTYLSQWDSDNPGTTLSSSYLALSTNWTWYNIICTVPASGKVTTAIGGGNTIQSSGQISLWGAHLCLESNYIDRLCFLGLKNVKEVYVSVQQDKWAALQSTTLSALPSGTAYGTNKGSLKLTMTTPFYATDGSLALLKFYPKNPRNPIECSLVVAGQAVPCGDTEWGMSVDHLSFSRKERDTTFGTVSFLKRGSSRRVRATTYVPDSNSASGDTIKNVVSAVDGLPVLWDFNASDTDYDRLRVYGFFTAASSTIKAVTWETLSLDVESLLEY